MDSSSSENHSSQPLGGQQPGAADAAPIDSAPSDPASAACGDAPTRDEAFLSWGRYPTAAQFVSPLVWRDQDPFRSRQLARGSSFLAQGLARSYGDSCLNDGNVIISTRGLNRILGFDRRSGRLSVESGMSLKDVLAVVVPAGWFLPVSPGTRFVSIGGAIANDIHGKNHHRAGSFGCHVLSFTLRRSDGSIVQCSANKNQDLFRATIGGLGLTGVILDAEIQLKKISSPYIDSEEIQFRSLEEFRALSQESAANFEYTVAWIDCVSTGKNFARGIFMRGNHAALADLPVDSRQGDVAPFRPLASVPLHAPDWALCSTTVRWFNGVYFHKQTGPIRRRIVPYGPFFYPLDSVLNWNRIYGSRGFFQFQCVVPPDPSGASLEALFRMVVESGEASFLAVLKEFGSAASPGMLSFPRVGTTLCLDFANRGERTVQLYKRLESFVVSCGGALYPAKDALMGGDSFERFYPRLNEFSAYIDPRCSSSFWRRVTAPLTARSIL